MHDKTLTSAVARDCEGEHEVMGTWKKGTQNLEVGVRVPGNGRSECLEMGVRERMNYNAETMG